MEEEQSLTAHLSPVTNKYTNEYTNISNGQKPQNVIGTEGMYNILLIDGKKYLKHKFKDIPLEEY